MDNKNYATYLICIGSIFLLPVLTYGQTCSCAGAPLISSQSISSASKGNLLLGVTYEYKDISNIYSGSEELNNRTVERNTRSTLLELNYGISDRLTLSATTTYVQKLRRTGLQNPGNEQTTTTSGLGDGLVMLKYVLHKNTMREQYQLAVGGGAKIPFGNSSLTQNGLALNADMQPGTGAWDGVLWSYFSKTFAPATTLNLFAFGTFRLTGENERFGSNDIYRFGNEFVSTIGATNDLVGNLSYIMMVQYRSTSSDQRNGEKLPNTGGNWINLKPALSYQMTNQISLRVSGELPVYQHLNGVQPTTAFTLSGSVFYNFSNRLIF